MKKELIENYIQQVKKEELCTEAELVKFQRLCVGLSKCGLFNGDEDTQKDQLWFIQTAFFAGVEFGKKEEKKEQ